MKLHYTKILLFALPLTILLTSYHEHNNNNEPHSTPHNTPIYISRVLSEGDTQSSIYDKDTGMKSVMQQFVDRTSQRFEEYKERLKDKRQKLKEERDKNIQEIIEKDKREKSLAEKIEQGCLKCGCGLGGVAASVGLFGGLGIYGWKSAAIATATNEAIAKGAAKGAQEGVKVLINKLKDAFPIPNLFDPSFQKAVTTKNYLDTTIIVERVKVFYKSLSQSELASKEYLLLLSYKNMPEAEATQSLVESAKIIVGEVKNIASEETVKATAIEMETLKTGELAEIAETSYSSYSAIGYSVLAILIIVLVLIIIYLVLRYRRKKKMNKKAQYTKLLNQ
ncbi:rifin PIR protein, putative [Plasmodium reichenowi]|uniref:Rifin PIR protein, putative n=1 Tax=Plasmodium reichenowi TaxID=5854 RepID=A0A2P9DE71_PLARE|nr:rifin PIR protein, putative [Plasmodium reichenowi]